jgi:hypothetical protein
MTPFSPPRQDEGIEAISEFWEAELEGPDEDFTMFSEVVAVDGRCRALEEWPFAPEQPDLH